jgi:uncharacterized protein YbjT (DUF2867 family)
MKLVITGSLGNISKPLTKELVAKGHSVTVISRRDEKKKDIEAIGAKAAIGTMEDPNFLTATFKGADAVYVMEAIGYSSFFDHHLDVMTAIDKMANSYKQAIQQSGVKHVVHLSSIGAHTNKGNGILAFHYNAENILKQLPADVSITFMRPVGFYYNLYGFIPSIKTQGFMASNYGADDTFPWVSPVDIAAAVAEELTTPSNGRKIRYVASEEISCNEIAAILGAAIGKPDLKWIIIPDEQVQNGLIAAGMNPHTAVGFTEMNAAIHSGKLYEDYYNNRPALGKTKITDFAREFAAVYEQK